MTQKLNWELTQEAWDAFLAGLDADRDAAGRRYEDLRARLITFFRQRQCFPPADWADETLDRVMRKSGEETIQNLPGYVLGVARRVASEAHRGKKDEGLDRDLPAPLEDPDSSAEEEQRMECLEHCLQRLFPGDRELILEYYRHQKREKIQTKMRMASAMGISSGNLRIRAFRLRRQVADCVSTCMEAVRQKCNVSRSASL